MTVGTASPIANVAGSLATAKRKPARTKRGARTRRKIVYLTSIFRLRCKPAVPYSEIAGVLLANFIDRTAFLAWLVATRELTGVLFSKDFTRINTTDLKGWLAEYGKFICAVRYPKEVMSHGATWGYPLPTFDHISGSSSTNLEDNCIAENLFHHAGLSRSPNYLDAQSAKREDIAELLFHSSLATNYVVVEDSERLQQANWKQEKHWKANSTPEGRPGETLTRPKAMQPPIGTPRPRKVRLISCTELLRDSTR